MGRKKKKQEEEVVEVPTLLQLIADANEEAILLTLLLKAANVTVAKFIGADLEELARRVAAED